MKKFICRLGLDSISLKLHTLCLSFIFLVILSGSKASFAFEPLERSTLEEIARISEEVKRRCPPEDCVVVGIGRSPSPITAYLKATPSDISYARNLPLSGFHHGVSSSNGYRTYPDLSEKDEMRLKTHFDKYLPSKEELHGRSILLVDYCDSGLSLAAAYKYIDRYYTSPAGAGAAKPHLQVAPLAIASSELLGKMFERNHVPFGPIIPLEWIDKNSLYVKFLNSDFEEVAEFGIYHVENKEKQTVSENSTKWAELFSQIHRFKTFKSRRTTRVGAGISTGVGAECFKNPEDALLSPH